MGWGAGGGHGGVGTALRQPWWHREGWMWLLDVPVVAGRCLGVRAGLPTARWSGGTGRGAAIASLIPAQLGLSRRWDG